MKPNSIVYTSNTGFTRQYAMLLGEKTGLPVYSLEEAGQRLAPGNTIVYLGWLMAGKVQGYAKASARYHVAAVCGVCMGATGSQIEDVRKTNAIGSGLPVFTLQGGFDMAKLRGVYKLMMKVMAKTVGKKLAEKKADMIVANSIASAGTGFGVDTNAAVLITKDSETESGLVSKDELARMILEKAAELCKK